jgi:hypothetical protein
MSSLQVCAGAAAGQADDKLSIPPRKLIKSEARVVDGKVRNIWGEQDVS